MKFRDALFSRSQCLGVVASFSGFIVKTRREHSASNVAAGGLSSNLPSPSQLTELIHQ